MSVCPIADVVTRPPSTAALKSLYDVRVGWKIGAEYLLQQQHRPKGNDEVPEREPHFLLSPSICSKAKAQIGTVGRIGLGRQRYRPG